MKKAFLAPWIRDPVRERMPRAELEALQRAALAKQVARIWERVPAARARFMQAGLRGPDAPLEALPFTTKVDLRAAAPFALFAVPRDQVVRVHASSGTTGTPTVVGYTKGDLALWAELIARALAATGVRQGTVVHNAYGYGLFTGGLGFGAGAERLGAMVVPASSGDPAKQLALIRTLGAEVLLATPSFAATLLMASEHDPALPLVAGIFGGEAASPEMFARLERGFGLRAHDTYGLSEVIGPGVAHACGAGTGAHLNEDHFLAEVIDPASGAPVPDGGEGELVLTSLSAEASPVVRYRTRDRVSMTREPCPCGRTFARLVEVRGRADEALEVRGREVFPSDVEAALLAVDGLAPIYEIAVDARPAPSRIEVRVEGTAAEERVRLALATVLPSAVVAVLPAGTLPRSEGKARRVVLPS